MTSLRTQAIDPDSSGPAFLNVQRSARGMRWVGRLSADEENTATAIAQRYGLPDILARVLAGRGTGMEAVPVILEPTVKALMPDPSTLCDMDRAAERFAQAIREGESIAVFGDYDVDGAACTALLQRFLAIHGLSAQSYIPDRLLEGYGPSAVAFERLVRDGAKLILTVDCGTLGHEPIARAGELGADVIVLDHHQADEHLPNSFAVVNPNRLDDVSGQGDLAAAGVVFLFLVAVMRQLRHKGWYQTKQEHPDLLEWLDLVALATVCDVVPLTGLNRAFVAKGLQVLHRRRNVGLRALADSAGLTAAPTPYHLGFVLGPRLNAGGRVGDSGMGARLLSTQDEFEAAEIAAALERCNAERKAIERAIHEEALTQVEQAVHSDVDAPFAVAAGEGWHKGLLGLVASRLTERFGKPSIVVSWDKTGEGTGSARSVPGSDIGAAVRAATENNILIRGGGHAMAAGFTMARDQFEGFIDHLQKTLGESAAVYSSRRDLRIDGALKAVSATPDLVSLLDKAGPFGAGNPQPRFALAAHHCRYVKIVGERHVKCALAANDGARMDAIAFNSADTELGRLLMRSGGMPLHVAGHLRRNDWGGREKIELMIEDAADPRTSSEEDSVPPLSEEEILSI